MIEQQKALSLEILLRYELILYQGEPVITLAMMDEFHGRPQGTAGRNFRANREKLILGVHFFELTGQEDEFRLLGFANVDEFRRRFKLTRLGQGATNKLILLTMKGYFLLSRSFTDPLARQVQDMVMEAYFCSKALTSAPTGLVLAASEVGRIAEVVAPRVAEIILPEVLGAISQLSQRLDEVESSMSRRLDEVEKRLWHDAINGRHNIRQFIERQMSKPQSSGDGSAPLRSQALQINASVSPLSRAAASEAWARLIAAWWNLFGGKLRRASEIAPLAEAGLLDADSSSGRSKQFARMAERCEGALYTVQDGALKVRLRRGERKAGSPMLYCLEPEL